MTPYGFPHNIIKEPPSSVRKRRIFDFLRNNPVGLLSTVTPDNDPHGSVVYFTPDNTFRIYFLTKTQTRKYDNIAHNSHVMLTVFDPSALSVAQITGTAEPINENSKVNAIARSIMSAYIQIHSDGVPPIAKLNAGEYAALIIYPSLIRMATYGRPETGTYNELFESIESFELDSEGL